MSPIHTPIQLLELQTHGLMTRLDQVKPLALLDVSVPAARISNKAALAIERHLAHFRRSPKLADRCATQPESYAVPGSQMI